MAPRKASVVRRQVMNATLNRKASETPTSIVVDTLTRHNGNIGTTSKELGFTYVELSILVNRSPLLQQVLLGQRESLIDLAEEKLRGHLEQGDLKAVMFTLKHLGARRGYVERQETRTNLIDAPSESSLSHDLTKLTAEQLIQLRSIKEETSGIIDIEATTVDVT